jgi:hypothetical protein
MLKFKICDYEIHLRMLKDVFDIICLEPIVDSHRYRSGCCNAKDGLEKCGRIRAQDANAPESVLA